MTEPPKYKVWDKAVLLDIMLDYSSWEPKSPESRERRDYIMTRTRAPHEYLVHCSMEVCCMLLDSNADQVNEEYFNWRVDLYMWRGRNFPRASFPYLQGQPPAWSEPYSEVYRWVAESSFLPKSEPFRPEYEGDEGEVAQHQSAASVATVRGYHHGRGGRGGAVQPQPRQTMMQAPRQSPQVQAPRQQPQNQAARQTPPTQAARQMAPTQAARQTTPTQVALQTAPTQAARQPSDAPSPKAVAGKTSSQAPQVVTQVQVRAGPATAADQTQTDSLSSGLLKPSLQRTADAAPEKPKPTGDGLSEKQWCWSEKQAQAVYEEVYPELKGRHLNLGGAFGFRFPPELDFQECFIKDLWKLDKLLPSTLHVVWRVQHDKFGHASGYILCLTPKSEKIDINVRVKMDLFQNWFFLAQWGEALYSLNENINFAHFLEHKAMSDFQTMMRGDQLPRLLHDAMNTIDIQSAKQLLADSSIFSAI